MNTSLVDPFVLAQDYPESLTGQLSKVIDRRHRHGFTLTGSV